MISCRTSATDTIGDMRVLVVTPWFPSRKAPASGIFNLRDVELLVRDHEITVLHLIRPDHQSENELDLDGFRVVRVPYSFRQPRTILSASRRIREMAAEAELVHSMAFSALLPMRWARVGIPWVHTEHFSQLVTPQTSPIMAIAVSLLKRLFKHPTQTVAVSRMLAKVIDEYRDTPSAVIGNEVMAPTGPIPIRRSEAAVVERIRMIGVGGVVERKGPIPAVQAMIELRSRGVDAELTWVGEGDLVNCMSKAAEEAGCADGLRLTGFLAPEALSRELIDADLFLLPVETETFGVAIAEALAHGLPVVTSGTGGHEEFLPPEASRILSTRSGPQLAEAVRDLLSGPSLWTRQEIADFAARRFSAGTRSEAYREVYSRAVELQN